MIIPATKNDIPATKAGENAMPSIDPNKTLDNYLERVMALQRERSQALTLPELKEVARELGLSDEDMAAADAAAQQYLQRGLGHVQHGLWDTAITELSSAVALNPASVPALYALATAHKERWRAEGLEEDRLAAERSARESLAIDPAHEPSFALLKELRDSPGPDFSRMSPQRRGRMLRIVALVLLVAVVVVLVLLIWGARRDTGATGLSGFLF